MLDGQAYAVPMKKPNLLRQYLSLIGQRGGKARANNLTSAQKSDIARKGALAMHEKRILHNAK